MTRALKDAFSALRVKDEKEFVKKLGYLYNTMNVESLSLKMRVSRRHLYRWLKQYKIPLKRG